MIKMKMLYPHRHCEAFTGICELAKSRGNLNKLSEWDSHSPWPTHMAWHRLRYEQCFSHAGFT